ncbi:Similar to sls: Titin (Drosophila melanogaster) [Cotesia congregata]|uniref:Similar to sls: Titin (Drosophila melanogaster) n=1 Tax=Cotesia congregata TaxID=51543 RepID=A0A8J2H798_COTCN|nr:Similar to sls: Titin (Drosophila melanogaster) [Cotesia congregata]
MTYSNMKVEWFFNGKPLPHKNRFQPIYDFGYVAMNFGWVYPEDSGEYLCRATNLYGMDETKAGNRYKLSYDGMYHLDIPKTRQYDHGKVEVVARSSLGEARCETTLTVKPRSDDYRGVLKNSPRREYLSPWGRGRWNTENLVDPPQD